MNRWRRTFEGRPGAAADRRRRRFGKGGAARRRGSAAGCGWRRQAAWSAVAAGADKLERGGLSLIYGERQCLLPRIPVETFLSMASFIRSHRGTSADTWPESTADTGDRKLALPIINNRDKDTRAIQSRIIVWWMFDR
jgi:hypothetical protein